jgi:hypothetical protein
MAQAKRVFALPKNYYCDKPKLLTPQPAVITIYRPLILYIWGGNIEAITL